MDFTPVIAQVLGMLIWFIPAVFLIALIKSPRAKGHIGELIVRFFAHRQLDEHTYRRLHNVTLNTPDGTTQIDHVFLSIYGIFALETKNMSGLIFGSEKQAQCTQKLYKRTFKFQSPLRQNYKHLKALEATLGVPPEHLHSVITFVGGSSFKTEMPVNVTQGIGLSAISSHSSNPYSARLKSRPCCTHCNPAAVRRRLPRTASMCKTLSGVVTRQPSDNARNAAARCCYEQ
ncbi:Nuclease-related domain-containing protein [Pseudomonas flavescens]|uniref:Nuclease-related domain-containing protein n=1 Tax=Phytopseudomonas flavescens TaxID=29435 RepID=A0A1G8FRC0_9GAMM|nr:Nuclease-related domain-containing protein [Pseudomonas flavescens]